MEVLIFQVAIALIIIIAGASGEKARNNATLVISAFTFFGVFMTWLLILQFITIIIAYLISCDLEERAIRNASRSNQTNSNGEFSFKSCFFIVLFIIIGICAISYFSNNNSIKQNDNYIIKKDSIEKLPEIFPIPTYVEDQSNDDINQIYIQQEDSSSIYIESQPIDYRYDDETDDPMNERRVRHRYENEANDPTKERRVDYRYDDETNDPMNDR